MLFKKDRKITKGGFTLIELLVVVLIIGILAAIALPRYKRAVVKTRVATAVSTMKEWEKIYDQYILANDCEFVCDMGMKITWDTFTAGVKGYGGQSIDPANALLGDWAEIKIGGWTYVSSGMGSLGISLQHSKDNHYNLDQDDLMYSLQLMPPSRCNPINGSTCSASWVTGPGRLIIDLPSDKSKEIIGPILKDLGAQEGDSGLWFL